MNNGKNAFALALGASTVLGGSGFPFEPGQQVSVFFDENAVQLRSTQRFASFSYLELADLIVAGPGAVTTGGGFIGGGFGVEGALEGMAIATVLNALSTKTKVHTFISIVTNFGELHLHHTSMEPGALRIALTEVHVRLRRLDPKWMDARTQVLDRQLAAGLITAEECAAYQARLLTPPEWPDPEAQRVLDKARAQEALENGPKGTCPNCDHIIPLQSDSCSKCKAAFGVGSAWVVEPI